VAQHSDGRGERVALTPDRAVGEVTRELLATVHALAGDFAIDLTPQEVVWTVALDEDEEHARYDPDHVAAYFAAATRAALVLSAFRAPYRGRSTPVNAWWGSFDLAVSLFSGMPADPPSSDFIMRNAMDAQEVAVGWWPGDARYGKAALYAYAHRRRRASRQERCRRRRQAGSRPSASTSSTGKRSVPSPMLMLSGCSSPARRSSARAWSAAGTRRFPPVPKGRPPPVS
jgi:hypothetical protein